MLVAVVRRIVDVMPATKPKPVIIEDVRPSVKLVEIKPPQPRQVDDDWFVLLDVAAKVPGILLFLCGCYCETESDNNMVSVFSLQFYYISYHVHYL